MIVHTGRRDRQGWDFLSMNMVTEVDSQMLLTVAHTDVDFRIRLRDGETTPAFIAAIAKGEVHTKRKYDISKPTRSIEISVNNVVGRMHP